MCDGTHLQNYQNHASPDPKFLHSGKQRVRIIHTYENKIYIRKNECEYHTHMHICTRMTNDYLFRRTQILMNTHIHHKNKPRTKILCIHNVRGNNPGSKERSVTEISPQGGGEERVHLWGSGFPQKGQVAFNGVREFHPQDFLHLGGRQSHVLAGQVLPQTLLVKGCRRFLTLLEVLQVAWRYRQRHYWALWGLHRDPITAGTCAWNIHMYKNSNSGKETHTHP